ncbi:hypothetical protein BK131_10015 [Paenibacillus amylolyticus]|uniref:Uncharacterized protein n=1 Tax=Paenibacillus amylolyticus TaxID=1451 RepID=A0A1R1BZP3_PAEAM|nr:hypothetical protein BK131_10015 [Paenibacillus amylolyticus]
MSTITTERSDVREILRLEDLRAHLGHPDRQVHLREVRRDSHLQGKDHGAHRDNRLLDSHHATKDHRSEMAVEKEQWAGMDRDKGKGTVGVVDNKGKDNPQVAGMTLNQGRMPCNKPPMTGLMISAYATVVSGDTAD